MYPYIYIHTHTYINILHVCVGVYIYIYMHIDICVYICIYVYIYIYIQRCDVCVCVRVSLCMHRSPTHFQDGEDKRLSSTIAKTEPKIQRIDQYMRLFIAAQTATVEWTIQEPLGLLFRV